MNPIYTIFLDDHKVESSLSYAEIKSKFLSWVEYTKQTDAAYQAVTVIKDMEVLLEYRRSNPTAK